MGTSVSSSGPSSGVRLVPPWVSDPDAVTEPDTNGPASPANDQDVSQTDEDNEDVPQDESSPLASPYRFREANVNLNRFAGSSSSDSLKRGIGQYVRKGLGGSHWASERMAGTTRRARALFGVLHSLSSSASSAVDLGIDTGSLSGRPAREILDRIIEALSPSDGTQDSEASRNSIFKALSRLIREDPTADLIALTNEQINLAIEFFIGEEICRRIELDVGNTILTNAPSPAAAIRLLGEINRYVGQAVRRAFRNQVSNSRSLTQRTITGLVSQIIGHVFQIFRF